ncbi:MAG: glycerol-3-phosphate 1-O-acyltransferase PlsY [Malacoplasma sp.]
MDGIFVLQFFIFSIIGYLIGNILFGLILSKIKKTDLRSAGSGNVGATNALRVFGKALGFAVFTWDLFKTWLAIFICSIIYTYWTKPMTSNIIYQQNGFLIFFSGLFTVIGHCFPIQFIFVLFKTKFNFTEAKKYSGGKGAAASAGFFMSVSPWIFLIAFSIFMIIFLTWRYVSLAAMISICVSTFLLLIPQLDYFYMTDITNSHILDIPVIGNNNFVNFITYSNHWRYIVNIFSISLLISIIVVWKHKVNIVRLINKQESKIFAKKE